MTIDCSRRGWTGTTVAVLFVAVVAGGLLLQRSSAAIPLAAAKPAKIIFVNVGQGDAVAMRIGGKIIVSDTGEFHYSVLDEALREGLKAKRIDVLILGHAHDDHAKNATELLRSWDVREVVRNQSLYWEGTKRNRAVMRAIEAEPNLEQTFPKAGDRFGWGGAEWIFVHPRSGEFLASSSRVAGNSSLAYLLTVNGVTSLFTGDIERRVADRVSGILDPAVNEPIDIFLATHHGSKEGSVDELLEVIRPRWAVLSTGKNSHEHPSVDAIRRLRDVGASIWCTDMNGSVTARISARGKLTWRASRQVAPWWSATSKKQTGTCVNR